MTAEVRLRRCRVTPHDDAPRKKADLGAFFALFHGHAHGAELPDGAGASAFAVGFSLATAALHALGVGLGLALARAAVAWLPRLAGAGLVAAGVALVVG